MGDDRSLFLDLFMSPSRPDPSLWSPVSVNNGFQFSTSLYIPTTLNGLV